MDFQQKMIKENKYTLPCKTLISTGSCPYRDRCSFIHDLRCLSPVAKPTTRKKDFIFDGNDLFFWTPNKSNQNNFYSIDEDFHYDVFRERCIWNTFIIMCVNCDNYCNESEYNEYTGAKRLSFFVDLSCK